MNIIHKRDKYKKYNKYIGYNSTEYNIRTLINTIILII